MTVKDVISQITVHNGIVTSKQSGIEYKVDDFIEQICNKLNFNKKQRKELESYFTSYLQPQSDKSKYIENIIDKYDFKFSDGVYFVKDKVITLDNIYRLLWKEERLLPTETDFIVENIEKISEEIPLQKQIFNEIASKIKKGKSLYLATLDKIYPNIDFRKIIYNILFPESKPMFHIFYDDGIGGTGKSTFLEVLTKIVGEKFTSNVLLDQFGNRFIFANMLGKYLNIGDDNGKNDELQNVGTLKSIVTGNRVTIDRKNISPIEVRIFAKQLFATNILPYIDFTDGGIMRRLNIVPMNKVIPKDIKLPNIDNDEIGHILYESFYVPIYCTGRDIMENNNKLAITSSPLYRFWKENKNHSYNNYQNFCDNYGFRKMNIINFETKSKFIEHFIEENKVVFGSKILTECKEDISFIYPL